MEYSSKAQKYHAQFRRKKTLMFDSLRLVTDYQKLKTNETAFQLKGVLTIKLTLKKHTEIKIP